MRFLLYITGQLFVSGYWTDVVHISNIPVAFDRFVMFQIYHLGQPRRLRFLFISWEKNPSCEDKNLANFPVLSHISIGSNCWRHGNKSVAQFRLSCCMLIIRICCGLPARTKKTCLMAPTKPQRNRSYYVKFFGLFFDISCYIWHISLRQFRLLLTSYSHVSSLSPEPLINVYLPTYYLIQVRTAATKEG